MEPSCRRDEKLFTNNLLYSGPRLVSTCLKFPCTSLGDGHKDIVLKSMLFTLDIKHLRNLQYELLTLMFVCLLIFIISGRNL